MWPGSSRAYGVWPGSSKARGQAGQEGWTAGACRVRAYIYSTRGDKHKRPASAFFIGHSRHFKLMPPGQLDLSWMLQNVTESSWRYPGIWYFWGPQTNLRPPKKSDKPSIIIIII